MQSIWKSNSISNLPGLLLRKRGMLTYLILGIALLGFESFNYSTTQYALTDLLGALSFAGIQWATILSIAFCGIDFAGIARLFTPEDTDDRTREVWFLFGAWLLAATMNAMLTWWGVSMALTEHSIRSTAIIDKKLLLQAMPVFIAIMVWVTRILLIGSFSMIGRQPAVRTGVSASNRARLNDRPIQSTSARPIQAAQTGYNRPQPVPPPLVTSRPIPTPAPLRNQALQRIEPEYIPDGESQRSGVLPALRPLAALSVRPAASNPEKQF